ncbi:4'-phosphopantetheinyl transferase family protein [Psychroflexus maritimus]|uniref:4'-phosphopantetheinyl transferase superfamily protein n=1 Tax=Psychroflexus maritimus TaxID=2714865 RepID=A0A967AGA4_9FLAO|nr:4'-phosphopantetheinyl transferase superfamily protein [Psychroflexus maritimus]NGZ89971.1 4'-phosphopantetheinyl transferase superfamily protein [Psychroflexus maritimus]
MPVYKKITIDQQTKVLIWKIEESLTELTKGIKLCANSTNRLKKMKSEVHQKGFLSIRHLLKEFGYTDYDLFYNEYGKPHLKDGNQISITHSFEFTAVIVSNVRVGIDIEKQRDKIVKIAPKFTPLEEYESLEGDNLIKKLTIVWGAKESLYKLYGKQGLLFLHDIFVTDFNLSEQTTTASVTYYGSKSYYNLHFLEVENYTCVYATENERHLTS